MLYDVKLTIEYPVAVPLPNGSKSGSKNLALGWNSSNSSILGPAGFVPGQDLRNTGYLVMLTLSYSSKVCA